MDIEFERPDLLPGVGFRLKIFESWRKPKQIVQVQLQASGGPERHRVSPVFREWAAKRRLRPTINEYPGYVSMEVALKSWSSVSDLLVYWLSERVFHRVIQEASESDARVGAELRSLRREILGLTTQVSKMQTAMGERDKRVRAAVDAFVGSDPSGGTALAVQS